MNSERCPLHHFIESDVFGSIVGVLRFDIPPLLQQPESEGFADSAGGGMGAELAVDAA